MSENLQKEDAILVSVVVPLYNKEQWVARCIHSILSQSYDNIEVLVVNDGSTDQSHQVVAGMEDRRIKLFDKPNGGVSSARNYGIAQALGEYIAFIDADDEWNTDHIRLLVKGFHDHSDAVVMANSFCESHCLARKCEAHFVQQDILADLSQNKFSLHIGSTMYRKSFLEEHHIRFNEQMKMGEDVNFMLRVIVLGECRLSEYRGLIYHHDDMMSAMFKKQTVAALTPLYFDGLQTYAWNPIAYRQIVKFLRLEYLKKSYQNRGLALKKEELSTLIGGDIQIGWWYKVIYLLIRFAPQWIFTMKKHLRSFRQKG